MTTTDSIQSRNLLLANWVNGVQQDTQPKTSAMEEFSTSFIFGVPLMVGGPLLLKKPYSVWQERQARPNQTWTEAWNSVSTRNEQEKKALEYLKDPKSRINTYKNKNMFSILKEIENDIPSAQNQTNISQLQGKELTKYNNAKAKNFYYQDVKKLIEEAKAKKMTGAELKAQLKKIHEAMAKADGKVNLAIQNGTIKPTSRLGKASHWIKSKTGVYKIKGSILKSAKGANILRIASKAGKGSFLFAAIEGITEIPNIISAYKVDSKHGNKQVVKSGVKVAASVGGFAAGSALTSAAAGALGGSVAGPIGTILGFAGGLIGGIIATKLAGKAMDKALGEKDSLEKNEAQIATEEKAKQQADAATNDIEAQKNLLAEVATKAEKEEGFDDQATLDAYNEILQERMTELGETQETDTSTGSIQGYDDQTQKVLTQLSSLAGYVA